MNEIEQLLKHFERQLQQPWSQQVAGPERIWIAVYAPEHERRLQSMLKRFELSTKNARHSWHHLDLSDAFGNWICQHRYRDAYFEEPELIQGSLTAFTASVKDMICKQLSADADPATLLAVTGIGALFGFASVSDIMQSVADTVSGRLVLFFPGTRDGANYRLLDARDGWNYLAVPITAQDA